MERYLFALAAFGAIFFGGFFVQRYFFPILRHLARFTSWEYDDIFLASLHRRVRFWTVLAALYALPPLFHLQHALWRLWQQSVFVLWILSAAFVISEGAVQILHLRAAQSARRFPSISLFAHLTKSLVFTVAAIAILHCLGISVAPLLTALGVGGLAVALALQDTLSNFFAGLHLLAARPIQLGDYIRLDSGEEGYVADITWRSTTIRDLMQNMVIVPNSKMTEAKIVNYNLPQKQMAILVQVSVTYDSDLEKVEKIALDVAKNVMEKVNGGASDHPPAVRFHSFGEYSVNFHVMLYVRQFSAQYYIRHAFIKRLQKRFILEAISLPEPTHTISFK